MSNDANCFIMKIEIDQLERSERVKRVTESLLNTNRDPMMNELGFRQFVKALMLHSKINKNRYFDGYMYKVLR